MVFDPPTEVYVRVVYVLMTQKNETAYYMAMNNIIIATNWQINPTVVTCDFVRALMSQAQLQFRESKIIGCFFHWKQAIRKKCLDLGLDRELVHMLMEKKPS